MTKMFRGEAKYYVEQRLLTAGWPQPLAGLTAAYMTGEGPLPLWPKTGPDPLKQTLDKLADEADRKWGTP